MSSVSVVNAPENTIIWGVMTATNQLLLPFVWIAIYGYAATGMVRGMGIGGAGGGATMGGTGASRALLGGGRMAGKKIGSVFSKKN